MAPKKDVTSCEKLRGVANRHRSVDIRMRELTISNVMVSLHEYIVQMKGTWGTETSNYPEEKKEKIDSESSGERNWKSPNHEQKYLWGCDVYD